MYYFTKSITPTVCQLVVVLFSLLFLQLNRSDVSPTTPVYRMFKNQKHERVKLSG